jgi:hypothetical protein
MPTNGTVHTTHPARARPPRLKGTLSEEVFGLPLLTNVYLESNYLSGTIPANLFHLKRLSYGARRGARGAAQSRGRARPHL